MHSPTALLLFSDGAMYHGRGIGIEGNTIGEICFNTSPTGYQEILTDPSYAGQIITFTFPHIGNVGVNAEDVERERPHAAGLIIREAVTAPSNFRSENHLNDWLRRQRLTGIYGADTRRITRHIREHGPQNVLIHYDEAGVTEADLETLKAALAAHPSMQGQELAKDTSVAEAKEWTQTRWELEHGYGAQAAPHCHVVAIDYGMKHNIARCLASVGCRVTIVPATASAADILAHNPDGVFLSNGPGDPEATAEYAVPVIRELLDTDSSLPIFGICLGHQLLARALGCRTVKMPQGHRGANQPVQDLRTGKVEITSQNHGFMVDDGALPPEVEITHRSLFDHSIQGIALKHRPVFSVQYHPEASPGPQDSYGVFEAFAGLMGGAGEVLERERA